MIRIAGCLLLVVPAALGLGACSADSGAKPHYSSGVDPSQNLGTLTPTQKQTICTSQAAFLHATVDTTSLTRFWCAFTLPVLSARDDATCNSAMDSCVQEFSVRLNVTVTDPNAPPPQCSVVDTGTCTGTVANYEDCVNSLAALQVNIGTDWQCGTRVDYPSSPLVGVDACKALGPTCNAVTGSAEIM